jgi:hypothetical protein
LWFLRHDNWWSRDNLILLRSDYRRWWSLSVKRNIRQFDYNYSLLYIYSYFCYILASFLMLLCCILDVYLSFLFVCTESLALVSDPTSRRFIGWLLFQTFIYIYIYNIRLKIKPNSVRIRFWAVNVLFFPRRDLISHHWYTAAPIFIYICHKRKYMMKISIKLYIASILYSYFG